MKDELYIDGAKIELPEKGTGIVLNRAVGKPADISSILSGFSYTIQLPKTANNIQAFGFSTEINVDSDYPHVEHTAKVIRDGVILFDNGIAVIKSVIQTIDVLISWGTDERLTILNNTKLNTLDMGKVRWDYGISNSELDYVTWVAGLDGRENQMPEHLRPAIRVSTIFNTLIGAAYQINSEYQNLINKMWLMLPTTNGNKETVGDLSFRIKGNATLENIKSRLYPDVLPQIFFDSKYDLIYRIAGKPQYVNIPLGGRYKIYGRINTTVPVGQWLFGIYTLPEETITEEYTPDFDIFSTTFTFLIDQYIEIGAGNICFGITSEHDEGEFDIDFQLFFEPENEKDYSNTAFLLDYPIGPNLPDISALDFIKSIMGVFGLMVEKGRDRLNLFNVDDIIASKKDAIDISGMLIDKNDDKLEYTYGLTKTNILKYAEDDLINKEYGSYTFSADTYDKKENVVYQSPYAAMEKSIPLYSITENGWELNKTSKCRLLIEDGERTLKVLDKFMNPAKTLTFKSFTFDNLKYENLVKKYWQGYIGVFANTPRIAYRKAILPPNFLPNYSFNTPVYASGNYYMLLSIKNYSGTGKADIELALLDNIKFVSPTNLKNVLIERYESPIKFDIDTVALYTRTGEEPNNGKLIRELDNIPTSEDLSQTYIPLDKGTGAALKILLKNLPFLRKDAPDVAEELIKFLKGAEFGEFISSMITGTGARIDASGHAEFDSVAIRKWLETPELRYNRVTVVGSEFWVTDGAKFDTVTKAGNLFIVKLKLEEGEIVPLFVGDILKGIYYDKSTDGKVKGFRTLWFRVNAVDQASQTITVASRYPDDEKYNPVPFLEVARIGSFTNKERQRSILIDGKENCITFLDNVNTWDITPAMEVCWFGRKDRSIPGVPSTAGYNAKLSNIIMSGKIFQYDEISGNDYLVPIDKGSYIPGRKYAYYDRVSATGGLWLCVNENGTTSAPGTNSSDWQLQVSDGSFTKYQFAVNTSLTTAPSTGWQDTPPAVASGQYLWMRTGIVTPPATEPEKWAPVRIGGEKGDKGEQGPQGIQGTQGVKGDKGDSGISQYFHVRYSANANGNPMSTTPNTYIGTVVTSSQTAPTSYTDYTWTQFKGSQGAKGEQGIPGTNGANGKTSYLHIKYSNDGKTFTANNGETPGAWIGQYVDYTEADSNTFSTYTWSKIKGDTGATGPKGDKGDTGDIKLNHLGADYSPYTAYKTGDVVPFNGGKIYCKKDNTGVTPVPFLKTGGKYLKTGNYYLLAVPLSAANLNKTYWEIFQDKPIVRATRWLTSNTSVIRFNTIGSPVPSTAIVQCKRQRDGLPVEDCADLWLTYRTYAETTYISQSTPVKTISVALGNFRADGIYYVRGYENEQDAKDWNGNFTTEYTITHANDGIGQAGATGASVRPRGVWNAASEYVWNDEWRDVVQVLVNGQYVSYSVKVKGTVPVGVKPDSSAGAAYWGSAQKFDFVATDLFLAEMAYIKNLGVHTLKTEASGVRIEIIPDGGNTRIKAINKNGETVMSIGFDSRDGEGNPKVQIRKDGKELTLFAGRMYVSGSSGRLLRIAESSTGKCMTISGLGTYDEVASGEMYRMDNNLVGIKP